MYVKNDLHIAGMAFFVWASEMGLVTIYMQDRSTLVLITLNIRCLIDIS